MRGHEVTIGMQEYINGVQVSVRAEKPKTPRVIPGETAIHEAQHVVAAIVNGTDVEEATVVPGPGYLGLTTLSRPDPIAAAAPHVSGGRGTGHDVRIIGMMGYSVNTVAGVARSIIAGNQEKVVAVASFLEEHGSANGFAIKEVMKADPKKQKSAEVILKDANGEETRIKEVPVTNGGIVFEAKWLNKKQETQASEVQLVRAA